MAGRLRDGIATYIIETGIAGTSPVQLQETRRAFYAGAAYTLTILFDLGDTEVSEDTGAAVLEALSQECKNFAIDVKNGRA